MRMKLFFLILFFSVNVFADPLVVLNSPLTQTTTPAVNNSNDMATLNARVTQLEQKVIQLQQAMQDLRTLMEMQGQETQKTKTEKPNINVHSVSPAASGKLLPFTPEQQLITVSQKSPLDKETEIYKFAFDNMQKKQYAAAASNFRYYLQQYPKGQYVSNVHYWLGEILNLSGDNEDAQQELETVINQYPNAREVPDAMLKMGMIAYDDSRFQQARQWWQEVIDKYPDSLVARTASAKIDQLRQEGY